MIIPFKKFKGLNTKENAYNREFYDSSDCLNVKLDDYGNLVKRFGFTEESTKTLIDMVYYKEGGYVVGVKSNGLCKWNGSSWDDIPNGWTGGTTVSYTVPLSITEMNGCLYFADPALVEELMKFDGLYFYRAGVPDLEQVVSGGAGSYYVKAAYNFRDYKGNLNIGEYAELSANDGRISVSALAKYSTSSKFNDVFAIVDGLQILTPANRTINVDAGHNIVPGFVWYYDARLPIAGGGLVSNRSIFKLTVSSVSATSITFEASSDLTFLASITLGNDSYISNINIEPFFSKYKDSNFESYGGWDFAINSINARFFANSPPIFTIADYRTPLVILYGTGKTLIIEDVYDDSFKRLVPFKSKYILSYQGVLIQYNFIDTDQIRGSVGYNNFSSIAFSSIEVGSSGEVFRDLNIEDLSDNESTEIVGVAAADDAVYILKDKVIYAIPSDFYLNPFTANKINANGVGCISNKSILDIGGGAFWFQSQDGIYQISKGQLNNVTMKIDDFFIQNTLRNLSKTRSLIDLKDRAILYFIEGVSSTDSVVIYFDLITKEIFKFSGYNAKNGFLMSGDNIIHSDGTKVYKINSVYNDNGVAISSKYVTGWLRREQASLMMRLINAYFYSIGGPNYTLTVKVERDYVEGVYHDTFSISFDSVSRFIHNNFDTENFNSARLTFENNVLNEGLFLNAIEFEVDNVTGKMKG